MVLGSNTDDGQYGITTTNDESGMSMPGLKWLLVGLLLVWAVMK